MAGDECVPANLAGSSNRSAEISVLVLPFFSAGYEVNSSAVLECEPTQTSAIPVPEHTGRVGQPTPSAFRIRDYAIPLLLGLLIRSFVALVWLQGTEPYNDGADYFDEATRLANGTREAVPFYWPPGTSYYLVGWFTLLGSSITVARIAMVVLSTAQIPVIGGLTLLATRKHRSAVTASWLWAVYPPAVFLVAQPYSQHLAGLSLAVIAWCGSLWLLRRTSLSLIFLGISIGVGCLTRPSMMSVLLLTVLGVFVLTALRPGAWWMRAAVACLQSAIVVVTAGAIVAPSMVFNAKTGGGYTLSTNNERNFFLGNNPHTPWYKTSHFAQRPLQDLPPEVREYLIAHYEASDRRTAMKQAALQHIRENPGLTLLRTVNRVRSFWGFDYLASRMIQATAHPPRLVSAAVLLLEAGGYCAIMLLGLMAIVRNRGDVNGALLAWYLAVIAAYAGPYCLAFASGTYHYPVMGLLVVFAAVECEAIRRGGWKQNLKSVPVWSVVLLFVAMQIEYAYFTLAAGVTNLSDTREMNGRTVVESV